MWFFKKENIYHLKGFAFKKRYVYILSQNIHCNKICNGMNLIITDRKALILSNKHALEFPNLKVLPISGVDLMEFRF